MKNKRLSGGDEFQVTLKGPEGSEIIVANVEDNENGTYLVKYEPSIAGSYDLMVQIGASEAVADSPYPVRVLPGKPDPKRSLVIGEGKSLGIKHNESVLQIEGRDKFGNHCGGEILSRMPLEIKMTLGSLKVPCLISETGKGSVE